MAKKLQHTAHTNRIEKASIRSGDAARRMARLLVPTFCRALFITLGK